MKKALYFILYICCFVTLASLLLLYLPDAVVSLIPAKVMAIIVGYVLPYGALASCALFGILYLYGPGVVRVLFFILHIIIVAALVIAMFFPEFWAKILSIFTA